MFGLKTMFAWKMKHFRVAKSARNRYELRVVSGVSTRRVPQPCDEYARATGVLSLEHLGPTSGLEFSPGLDPREWLKMNTSSEQFAGAGW